MTIDFKSLPWKKIGAVAGFIAVCLIMGYAIFYVFFRTPTPVVTPINQPGGKPVSLPISGEITNREIIINNVPVNIPTGSGEVIRTTPTSPTTVASDVAEGGLTKVSDVSYNTTDIALDPSANKLMGYDSASGQFFKINDDGTKTQLSDKTFKNVQTVTWAPHSEKTIMEFPDGSNILYDFTTGKQITLPKNWTEFSFSADESQIGFKDMDNNVDKRFVGISNPDGSNQQYIEHIGSEAPRVKVQWSPNKQVMATYEKGANSDFQRLYFIGPNAQEFGAIDLNGYGAQIKYTPDAEQIVYSAHNSFTGHKPQLNIVDASGDDIGGNSRVVELSTWANKCTITSNTTMYCAVPKEMPEGAGWFPELADNIGDYIYQVDLQTGSTSFIAEPEVDYSINKMIVSADGSKLYFTDKTTQTLHEIKLK